jgi:hypothetical protein
MPDEITVERNAGLARRPLPRASRPFNLIRKRCYAKDESVQQSLARIHTRLDETATKEDVRELLVDLRKDIKTVIAKSGA